MFEKDKHGNFESSFQGVQITIVHGIFLLLLTLDLWGLTSSLLSNLPSVASPSSPPPLSVEQPLLPGERWHLLERWGTGPGHEQCRCWGVVCTDSRWRWAAPPTLTVLTQSTTFSKPQTFINANSRQYLGENTAFRTSCELPHRKLTSKANPRAWFSIVKLTVSFRVWRLSGISQIHFQPRNSQILEPLPAVASSLFMVRAQPESGQRQLHHHHLH